MARAVLAVEDSQFVALVNKAALLAEQLGSGLYEASDEVEGFPAMVDTIRMKHSLWSAQLKQYGAPGQSLLAPLLQAASKKLKEEEVRLRKLHSSCYMKCFASSSFKFPKELYLSFYRMIDFLENLPLQMRETEEVVRDIMITTTTSTSDDHDDRDQEHHLLLPDPEKITSADDHHEPLLEHHHDQTSKPRKQRSVSRLPFYADKRYVPMSGSVLEVRGFLERRSGPHVVVLQGGPGTGKSSLARYLALHYQDKQVYYPGQHAHFADGVFYLACGGGVDIKAKQLELLHILDYPLHLLLTSGESQQLSEAVIHKKLMDFMEDKDVLVVLDDVEDYDLLHHLMVPSSRVKYLVTSELELQWENSSNFTMPPLRIEDARRILAQHIDLPEFIPAHLQDVADAIIIATGANPLALVSLSLAVNSGPGSAADTKEWLEVERKFRMLLDEEDEDGLIAALGEQYPRHVACSMALAVDYLPHEAKLILFALAAFDDLPIPEVVVQLLVQCTTGNVSNFACWRDYLASRGLIQQQQNSVPWSSAPQSTLTIHGIRKHCVKITKEVEISMLIDSLLSRLGNSQDELSSDAALMTALCVVYGEGELAVRAAAKLSVSNFSHMGSLILTWLAPFVSLLAVTDDDPYPKQPPLVHVLARQVILEFICNRSPENGITGLLAIPESALTTCWALALHALDKPLLIASEGILKGLITLLGKNVPAETQKRAAWALTNIAVSDDKQYNLGAFPGFLKGFVRLLTKDSQPETQTIAAWTMMVVAEAEESRVDIVAFPGALEGLVALLGRNVRPDTQINGAWALANLTGDRDNKITVAEFPGALEGLVGLLAKDMSPVTQSKAAWALANMAEAEENKLTIAAFPGALEGLVRLLSVDDFSTDVPRDQQSTRALGNLNAAWALANLSDAKVNKESIAVFPGALEGLVRLLNKDVNPQTRCSAAWTLVHLAEATETKVKVIIAKIPGALEGLVSLFEIKSEHNHRDMQQQATWAWRNLSAAWALGSLADAEENKTMVANCPGALKGLVGLLGTPKHGSLHLQSRAAWAIANIAAGAANQELIAAYPGALEGLVGLLQKDVNPYTQSNALRALAHIVEAKNNRVLLAKFPGALENLVGLLGQDVSSYTQNNAARALATMATAGENQITIAKFPGALEGFVRLLGKDESPAVQTNAAWALANLAEESMNKIGIALFPEAIERLLRLLEDDIDPSVQAVAARTLTQIDARTNNRLILSSAEAYRSRAVINIEMENYKQALGDLDRAHALQPENPYTFSWRRFVRVMLKEYEGALQDANKAIELQPHKQFHWQERGILRGMMGDFQGALEDLTRGLQLNPDDYESLKHRGYIRYLLQDHPGACDDAEKALAYKPPQLDDPAYGAGFLGGLCVEYLGYKLK